MSLYSCRESPAVATKSPRRRRSSLRRSDVSSPLMSGRANALPRVLPAERALTSRSRLAGPGPKGSLDFA